jgi:choice-of-anchor C domain-containing protein
VLWLAIVLVLALAIALAVIVFIVAPERERRQQAEAQRAQATLDAQARADQATATAEARMSELQRAYEAGVAFAEAGDRENAAQELARVVALEPGYKDAAARLAEVRANADAAQATATAQAHASEVQQAYDAGVAFAEAGDWEKAAEEFARVVALEPGYKDAATRLTEARTNADAAQATATARTVAMAQQAAATATAEIKSATESAYQRGLAYFKLERWEQARVEFEQVIAVDPSYKDVQARLAEVEVRLAEIRALTPTLTPTPIATNTPSSPPANVVTNGDFEVPNAGSSYVIYKAGQTFGGWMVESGSVDQGGTWQVANGNQSVDLSGEGTGAIYQDLSTIPGQTYLLRFAMAGNPYGGPAVKRMEIWWGNTLVDTLSFDITGRSTSSMGWVYHEYTVVATANVTRLRFKSLTSGTFGPALDDVTAR